MKASEIVRASVLMKKMEDLEFIIKNVTKPRGINQQNLAEIRGLRISIGNMPNNSITHFDITNRNDLVLQILKEELETTKNDLIKLGASFEPPPS